MFRFFIRGSEGQPHQIFLYDVIGESFWEEGVTAKAIVGALAEAGDGDVIVRINCRGGSHDDGVVMYNAFAEHKGQITMRVEGYACSMGTVVLCAASVGKVQAYETALLMIHRSSASLYGNMHEALAMAEMLERADLSMATAYGRKMGKTPEQVLATMDEKRDTWLTPEEAKTMGLIDEVVVPKKFTALLDPNGVKALAADEGAALLRNIKLPERMRAALEGFSGVMACHVTAEAVTPIGHAEGDADAETEAAADADADTDAGGGADADSDAAPAADAAPVAATSTPVISAEAAIKAERDRIQAIRAQASKMGLAGLGLEDALIDEGLSVEAAGKMLLSFKVGQQQQTSVTSAHQHIDNALTVKASWDTTYKKLQG